MRFAIVILNWNGVKHLEKYLPSVVGNTPVNCNIFVADNGSDDGSVGFLKTHYPQITLIELDKNYGFAGGYNKALKQVDADIYCLLNSDVRLTSGCIEPFEDLFLRNSAIAAAQPKILSDRDNSRFEHAGAAGGFIDKYGYPFCRGRIMNEIETDKGQYNQSSDIFWATGACLFIRSSVFHSLGGFDPDFFAHMEEIDLCWRIKNQGHHIVYCPESTVYHYGGATLDYNNPRKLYLNFRNSLWTLYKNYTGNNLHCMLFKRKCIDTVAIAKYFLSFDFKNCLAIIKAHLAYYRSKPRLKVKRKQLLAKVVKTKQGEVYGRSIVWQFFVKGKKNFSEYSDFKNLNNTVFK